MRRDTTLEQLVFGIVQEQGSNSLIDARTVFETRLDGKHIRRYKTLSELGPVLKSQRQFRKPIVQGNLSTPNRPRNPKAKTVAQTVKASARVRTYDAPSDLGQHSARFHDPVGQAFKARTVSTKRPSVKTPSSKFNGFDLTDPAVNGYRFSDLPLGYDDSWVCLFDARMSDKLFQYALMARTVDFPQDAPSSPVHDATAPRPSLTMVENSLGVTYLVPYANTPAYQFPAYRPATLFTTPRDVLQPRLAPKPLAIPPADHSLSLAGWNHPPAKLAPVLTVVTRDPETKQPIAMDCPAWNGLARKRLFEKVRLKKAATTSPSNPKARAACYRYIPKNPSQCFYMVAA